MKFLNSSLQKQNRPTVRRLPVLLRFLAITSLFMGFQVNSTIVYALNTSSTPEPASTLIDGFVPPDSGEPVILTPGNKARLVSPIHLKLATKPGDDGIIRIELIGHDNRLIFRKLMPYADYRGEYLLIEQEIPFEIRSDEAARLQVVLENSKGKPIFINSITVTLLEIRGTETKGDDPVNPRFKIDQPTQGQTIQGEFLVIKGGIKPVNNTPIVVELLATDWHTLTSKIVSIKIPEDQTAYTPIEVKLPYKTGAQIPATLRIRQESNNLINGTVLLWSEMITLVK